MKILISTLFCSLMCYAPLLSRALDAEHSIMQDTVVPPQIAAESPIGTIVLEKDRYYRSEGRIREEITVALNELIFNDQNELITKRYQIDGESDGQVFDGAPSIFILDRMLRFSQYKRWELVVSAETPEGQAAKIAALKAEVEGKFERTKLQITAYKTRAHERVDWDCISSKNGLFIRAYR